MTQIRLGDLGFGTHMTQIRLGDLGFGTHMTQTRLGDLGFGTQMTKICSLSIINRNILTKFNKDWKKNEAPRVT
ncbi:hypothetical protein DPMN_116618 [Dreissena polymorpha]|uniref:Uncharacterized protein n=1 Tax=Dreissena polymorpha TaxID=45954 RepID=A0A9D4KNW3_DREPO|nr:hypothetical protein DPMN_116618 [Dreissena polymorpha]